LKVAKLSEFEKLSQEGLIDLFYGDESHICSEGYVPYGWQFKNEEVYIAVEKGHKINIWGLISRDNRNHWEATQHNIDAKFVFEQLEDLSLKIKKITVIIFDNASIHSAKLIENQLPIWQNSDNRY
jgi:hypothetical protein